MKAANTRSRKIRIRLHHVKVLNRLPHVPAITSIAVPAGRSGFESRAPHRCLTIPSPISVRSPASLTCIDGPVAPDLIGFRNKGPVMLSWTYSYCAYKRGVRLIYGALRRLVTRSGQPQDAQS